MTQIKALLVAAACCLAVPAFAADAAQAPEKAKATKAEATKKAEPKEKLAGDVKQPVVTRDTAVATNGDSRTEKPYNLSNESWVYDEDDKSAR